MAECCALATVSCMKAKSSHFSEKLQSKNYQAGNRDANYVSHPGRISTSTISFSPRARNWKADENLEASHPQGRLKKTVILSSVGLFNLNGGLSFAEAISPQENIHSSGVGMLNGMNPVYEVASVLEASVQLLYLGALLVLLGGGSFLVVRQVLVRRELENAAKDLQDRVRSGEASCEEYFELGAIMLRKKFYMLSNKYLEQAITRWDGDEQDLAQVHNALGFSYFSDNKVEKSIAEYKKAIKLQPGYVVAWNNLGNALEKKSDFQGAYKAYQEALTYDPSNTVASSRAESLAPRVKRAAIPLSKPEP